MDFNGGARTDLKKADLASLNTSSIKRTDALLTSPSIVGRLALQRRRSIGQRLPSRDRKHRK
jgi:hypothetical protein